MFDKRQQSCVTRIHLLTDDGFYDRKAFYTVKIVFYSSLILCTYLLKNVIRPYFSLLRSTCY